MIALDGKQPKTSQTQETGNNSLKWPKWDKVSFRMKNRTDTKFLTVLKTVKFDRQLVEGDETIQTYETKELSWYMSNATLVIVNVWLKTNTTNTLKRLKKNG